MYAYSSPAMYSFGSAIRGEELKTFTNYHTPGPGTYEQPPPEAVKDAYPSWKVGTSKRPALYSSSNKDIGPGAYEVAKPETKKHDKKTFPRGKRGQSEFKGMSTVGPDAYNPKGFSRVPPSFSFGYKGDSGPADRTGAPGPGAYDVNGSFEQPADENRNTRSCFNSTAPHAMTRSKDPNTGSSWLPGPGAHFNPEVDNFDYRFFAPTWSFGKGTRDGFYDGAKHVPGPGKYNLAGTVSSKTGFTILGKNKVKGNTCYVPAPNVYNQEINPLRRTAPAFRIGKSERKDMSTGNPEFPGPGAYYHEEQIPEKGTRMGTSQRPGLYTQDGKKNPGPGQYDVRGNIANSVQYSMGVKCNPKKSSDVFPGPGEYEPFESVYLEKNNGAIIGTSERPLLYKKGNAPGPGKYEIRGNIGGGQKSSFGTAKRQPMAKDRDEPAPGYYNLPSSIGNVQKYLLPSFAQERRKAAGGEKDISFRGIFGAKNE